MGTEIICGINECRYNFDNYCTREKIMVSLHDQQPICATFYDMTKEANQEIQRIKDR
jgi:hypothetical protein